MSGKVGRVHAGKMYKDRLGKTEITKVFITIHSILFDIAAKRPDITYEWDMEKKRLRKRLNSLDINFRLLRSVCSNYILLEFRSRTEVYYSEEAEMDKFLNNPDISPFGVDMGSLKKILDQLETLVMYLRELKYKAI